MEQEEAVALIGAAVTDVGGTWADLGAGTGTFTRALASLIGPSGVVYAVDRDAHALRTLSRAPQDAASAAIRTVVGDFTEAVELPALDGVVRSRPCSVVRVTRRAFSSSRPLTISPLALSVSR